jgi:hypothetical protein
MSFRIPKQQKPVRERIDVKLERTLLETLDQYCQYLESDRDYAIANVLLVAFKKDKGFAAWRAAEKPADPGPRLARA